ncbi:hypothetical protein RND81_03G081500 [Saponaria officinalis]|uniref:GOLD domain-containing protein n=1 Tax=Saponaria officinalis TaxID=3572 RepID=A0AAW1LYX5_SAPOF
MQNLKLLLSLNIVIIIIIICLNIPYCDSFRFNLQSGSTKCITEDIKHNSMTVGKYAVVSPADGRPLPASHRITARVTSPRGYNYHYGDVVETGTFAFTAPDTGDYMTCFWAPYHNPPLKFPIDFDWKTGVDAKDWYNVARKGQLDLLDIELRKLYNTVRSIHDEMYYLREREEEMQQLNKSTKSNMAILSFFLIIIVSSVALMQLWHLKEYFERKKLL